jgi:hypothetical protein
VFFWGESRNNSLFALLLVSKTWVGRVFSVSKLLTFQNLNFQTIRWNILGLWLEFLKVMFLSPNLFYLHPHPILITLVILSAQMMLLLYPCKDLQSFCITTFSPTLKEMNFNLQMNRWCGYKVFISVLWCSLSIWAKSCKFIIKYIKYLCF